MTMMRIDKWLWAARFYKTRSLAAHACDLGRVSTNGQSAKPSRDLRAGDLVQLKTESGDLQVTVLALSEVRGPAAVAQTLYAETEASRVERQRLAEQKKTLGEVPAVGKLSKRDRRERERFKTSW
ncbi:MAG: RNA-binding S4 domain-containing protein [Bryobacteraceae bacterium]|nr:RNA-binding S4 domain-containing protein [Bryobacteraceae bacterium]